MMIPGVKCPDCGHSPIYLDAHWALHCKACGKHWQGDN